MSFIVDQWKIVIIDLRRKQNLKRVLIWVNIMALLSFLRKKYFLIEVLIFRLEVVGGQYSVSHTYWVSVSTLSPLNNFDDTWDLLILVTNEMLREILVEHDFRVHMFLGKCVEWSRSGLVVHCSGDLTMEMSIFISWLCFFSFCVCFICSAGQKT